MEKSTLFYFKAQKYETVFYFYMARNEDEIVNKYQSSLYHPIMCF